MFSDKSLGDERDTRRQMVVAPLFIAIEGIDGTGKTTLLRHLRKLLSRKGIRVLSFTEPGHDNPIGRAFRELSKKGEKMPPYTSACLLAAERYWRSEQVSRWLEEGFTVFADRYYLSGLAYCGAEGIPFGTFSSIHEGVLKPDLYIYLDVPLAVAFQRKGEATDRWEEPEILRKVARLYPTACNYIRTQEAAEVYAIDATKTEAEVVERALQYISRKL